MKRIIFLVFVLQLYTVAIAQSAVTDSSAVNSTEWIAVKESSIDSVTLNYFKDKGMVTYTTPKDENNTVFVTVVSYIADLLDSSLSAISKNANKFYDTPIGFWATWGTFYHYVGDEILHYLLTLLYLIIITLLFLWLWKKHCIHKMVPVDPTIIHDKNKSDSHNQHDHKEEKEEPETVDTNIVRYEIATSSVTMQFWLLILYIVLFFIGACVL